MTVVQLVPPFVVLYSPTRLPPRRPNELKRPTPAQIVFVVASWKSNSMAPIAEVACVSVSGVQFGLLRLGVRRLPDAAVDGADVEDLSFVGWARTVWMAPTIVLFGCTFSIWPSTAGPGPCAVHAMGPIGGWPEAAMGSASAA